MKPTFCNSEEIILKPLTLIAGLNGSGKTKALKGIHSDWQNAPGVTVEYIAPTVEATMPDFNSHVSHVILENPEYGLHAWLQTLVGNHIVCHVRNGKKIVIETHSEHILNAIRIAVREKLLTPGSVALYWFARQPSGQVKTIEPKIDINGRIDQWPDGFFDEWDKALEKLL